MFNHLKEARFIMPLYLSNCTTKSTRQLVILSASVQHYRSVNCCDVIWNSSIVHFVILYVLGNTKNSPEEKWVWLSDCLLFANCHLKCQQLQGSPHTSVYQLIFPVNSYIIMTAGVDTVPVQYLHTKVIWTNLFSRLRGTSFVCN